MALDTQMTLALLQELLMALRADDADGNFKKLDWIHFNSLKAYII